MPERSNAHDLAGIVGAEDVEATNPRIARAGASAATVAAARAPFVEAALRQSSQLGTPEARDLAHRMLDGLDNLQPEEFYALSSQLELLFNRSPKARAEANERSVRWAREEVERRREADRAALGVGARAREGQTWL